MQPIHVLMVDDEERFTRNLSKILKTQGFEVYTAASGPQALALLADTAGIEVVLLDVRMPGIDGLETLRRIRQMSGDIEVIMLTGHANLDDGLEAVREGAFDYLQKPYDVEDLIVKIRSACNVGRIRRHPLLWPRTQAAEVILSGFIPLLPEDKLARAVAIFERYRNGEGAQMLFVVDDRQKAQGLITKRDILDALAESRKGEQMTWEWVKGNAAQLPQMPLSRIMRRPVETVAAETPLDQTAEQMLRHHYDSMPVVADGEVLGIVRLRDVLHFITVAQEQE